ncbi:hypothetical protein EQ718_11540 [Paracoccus versutus]|uniref:Uncharacterized protein n=1 Tax=Paracoccus versutus TaxID=34007 RepID=A0A099FBD0_PARVE|nr:MULTISPECIES: hypothetical protein [Paracoccus]SFY40563.1 hypothetical protein SAMN04244548_04205 [Paracoccus pantotrophus]KGJ07869.1 hypothetical protein IT40_19790 [Paracoccus versutus]MBT0778896.1 hypothetical protein [Paracoccus sp. pheM1]MCJ1901973.1 hypothetical protein [Paracoccus versutus]MDF3906733.1 hypothetical protein [Paracoccus sp. AS002]
MTRNILLALMPVLVVASCGTPQEQCISRNTREYRTVSNLLAEVEANLARGYAWEERTVMRTQWEDCRYVWVDKDGNRRLGYRPCLRDVADTERYRVPIDPAAETRKRDNLLARKQALMPAARAAVDACKAAYPEKDG